MNHLVARELRVYGEKGSYLSQGTDVQAQAIFAGKRPADDLANWGFEPRDRWGTLHHAEGDEAVPSEQGAYHAYYEAFAEAVRNGNEPPVTAKQAIDVLAVLDAAFISARENRVVTID